MTFTYSIQPLFCPITIFLMKETFFAVNGTLFPMNGQLKFCYHLQTTTNHLLSIYLEMLRLANNHLLDWFVYNYTNASL